VVRRCGLGVLEEKTLTPAGIRTPDRPGRSRVTVPSTLCNRKSEQCVVTCYNNAVDHKGISLGGGLESTVSGTSSAVSCCEQRITVSGSAKGVEFQLADRICISSPPLWRQ
jgi:hypothetical protein